MAFTPETAAKAGSLSSRKGKPNNLTKESREVISSLVNGNFSKFEEELKTLKGKDYCDVMLKLMEYHVPKLNRTELIGDPNDYPTVVINLGEGIKPGEETKEIQE